MPGWIRASGINEKGMVENVQIVSNLPKQLERFERLEPFEREAR